MKMPLQQFQYPFGDARKVHAAFARRHLGVVAHASSPLPEGSDVGVQAQARRPRLGQRKDNNKTRFRKVTNPDNLPLRHPRTGVKTARWIADDDSTEAGFIVLDDDLGAQLERGEVSFVGPQ